MEWHIHALKSTSTDDVNLLFFFSSSSSSSNPGYTDGRVAPRSGLAYKHGIDTLAGVIDADYRGPVGVILANLSDTDFAVKVGDRIAQLVVEKIVMPDVVVVNELEASVRGAGGFGSTGGFGAGATNSLVDKVVEEVVEKTAAGGEA